MKFGAFPNKGEKKKIDSAVLSSFNVLLFVFNALLPVFLNRGGFIPRKSLSQNPTPSFNRDFSGKRRFSPLFSAPRPSRQAICPPPLA